MYDIIFLHPPQSFDKLKYPLSGVFSALVGSTDILGHEPVGMISMANDLSQSGYNTKIFNVGKMLLNLRYQGLHSTRSVEGFLENLNSRIYGIGLHWAAHAPGAIELARLIKQYHPQSLILLGGITSTYYYREIMEKFPFIDLVVLGEVDGLIREIVDMLLGGMEYRYIPNIAYRRNGEVVSTELRPPVKRNLFYMRGCGNELIEPNADFSKGERDYIRNCMIPLVHGCHRSCPFCGGSRYYYKRYFCRNGAEGTAVEEVVANIKNSIRQGVSGFSLFGDVRLLGDHYWKRLTSILSQEHMHFDLYLELFSPATREYMEAWRNVTSGEIVMTLSPESADADVRSGLGKDYSNEDIIKQVALATDSGVGLSLGFMFALPKQDFASIVRTQDFVNDLCHKFNRLISYMFEPFLLVDPGCLIFDYPERYGYTIEDRTLEGLIKALTKPHWCYILNYYTRWIGKQEIIDAIFFVGSSRNQLRMEFLGPSQENLFNRRLVSQQRDLVNILMQSADLRDEEVEDLIERNVDQDLRKMNLSITGPDLDLAQQKLNMYSISEIFRNTLRVIGRCYGEIKGQKDLLSALQELGFFSTGDIPVEKYREELTVMRSKGTEPHEISCKIPKEVRTKFYELLSSLGLSLEKGLTEEFIQYDWASFVINLYTDAYLKDLYKGGNLPEDIKHSDLLLPLKNAYVKLRYRPEGRIIHKANWLTLEKSTTYLLISHTGVGYVIDRKHFHFLKVCRQRMPFSEFYKRLSRQDFIGDPDRYIDWLLSAGFILFAPIDFH